MEDMFIGGHPMAGSELTGYANSSAAIMKNARYVITPTAKTTDAQLERFKALICDMKANPIVMDYATHDKTVAAISHLPHLISTALVKLVSKHDDSEKHMQMLAAGSFRDMTRVAASSPEMWDQICASNSEDISALLGDYIDILSEIKNNIDNKTPGYVNELLKCPESIRIHLGNSALTITTSLSITNAVSYLDYKAAKEVIKYTNIQN